MVNYLIRIDDACPYMDAKKWQRMEDLMDKYGVKPLVGIIPANADPQTMIEKEDPFFWGLVHRWMEKGWTMALHGYDHVCISENGMEGLNPMWKRSEFAGISLETQREKIRKGIALLKEKGINPKYFFAPSHTFDINTLVALESETDIRIISDTIALRPYKKGNFVFIPQISGHCVNMLFPGLYTFCFHPNTMCESAFTSLEFFLKKNNDRFIGFDDIIIPNDQRLRLFDSFLSRLFFVYRRLRGLI